MARLWLILLALFVSGCATLVDTPSSIVGFSTRDLEDARAHSVYHSYRCSLDQCDAAILAFAEKHKYSVFMRDKRCQLTVLMGIPGYVNTTEVGIFLSVVDGGVRVELSSRSSPAKRAVALKLFSELAEKFPALE